MPKPIWRCEPGKEHGVLWLIATAGDGNDYGLAFRVSAYSGMRFPTALMVSMVQRIERAIHYGRVAQ